MRARVRGVPARARARGEAPRRLRRGLEAQAERGFVFRAHGVFRGWRPGQLLPAVRPVHPRAVPPHGPGRAEGRVLAADLLRHLPGSARGGGEEGRAARAGRQETPPWARRGRGPFPRDGASARLHRDSGRGRGAHGGVPAVLRAALRAAPAEAPRVQGAVRAQVDHRHAGHAGALRGKRAFGDAAPAHAQHPAALLRPRRPGRRAVAAAQGSTQIRGTIRGTAAQRGSIVSKPPGLEGRRRG
mmetsp:Transcript_11460/g.48903  ORF Transcript_11460/g.48903 Transcript_11460/m.48903 type:complete len:243 (-) Transcript_11460:277-1005(-)